jgi:hypothetical protein
MYVPLEKASELFDIPRVNLQKLHYKDKKNGAEGRFREENGVVNVFVGAQIGFPDTEKLKELYNDSPWFFSSQKEMAKVISRASGHSEWGEYMNLRNFKYKNPKRAKIACEAVTKHIQSHPMLFSVKELER